MNTYWRLLGFAKPIEKYAIPYFFYTLFYSLFNTFNFVMIIPILNSLFDPAKQIAQVTSMPAFALNMDYFDRLVNFLLYKIYGPDYSVMNVMLFLSIFIVSSALLSNMFRYLGQWTIENMKIHTLRRLRNAVFDNVMGLHVGYFSNERKGDIISKITSDVTVVQFCITNTLQVAFREPFLIIGYMIALVKISWELTIFSAIFLPLTALLIGSIVKRLRQARPNEAQENFGDMTSLLDEALTGVKVVKGYNATGYITGKFRKINDIYSRITRSHGAAPAARLADERIPRHFGRGRAAASTAAASCWTDGSKRPGSSPTSPSSHRLRARCARSPTPSATSTRASPRATACWDCSTRRAASPKRQEPSGWNSSATVSSSATCRFSYDDRAR